MLKRFATIFGVIGLSIVTITVTKGYSDDAFDKFLADKNYKAALDYADDKIPATSRSADVWVKLAKANEELNLPEKALACYLVSWRLNPKDYESIVGAARIYNKLDQPDNAASMAQK